MKHCQNDVDSAKTKKTVLGDTQDGDKAVVEGKPSVFVNGLKYNGSLDRPNAE